MLPSLDPALSKLEFPGFVCFPPQICHHSIVAYGWSFDFLVIFCHTLTLAYLLRLSSDISDEIFDRSNGFCML